MATLADIPPSLPSKPTRVPLAAIIDRWIYVFMAGLFLVTALAGFIPDSLMKIELVESGKRAPFPAVLHVHAVLMGSFLLLLLAQTTLMATGRRAQHQVLGRMSLVLVPAIVVTGLVLVPTMQGLLREAIAAAPPEARAPLRAGLTRSMNIMLLQLSIGVLFPLFIALAIKARRRDPASHKRLMILATALPLPAAVDRMIWLPSTLPDSPLSPDLYTLLWVAPMFVWDYIRQGRVHRSYLIWLAAVIPVFVAQNLLWGSDWWLAIAPRLLGYPA